MNRRLRIGVISPRIKGSTFGSNAAPYPPPSALHANKSRKPSISEMAVRKTKGPTINEIAEIFPKRKVQPPQQEEAFDPVALEKVFQYATFEVPEAFAGFGRAFKGLNSELCSIHSDSSLPPSIRLALDSGVSSFNKQLSADAADVGRIHRSKQYIASLRVSDHYEKKASEFISEARKHDLPKMIETAGRMGINLPNLLYKRGVYIKLGKRK